MTKKNRFLILLLFLIVSAFTTRLIAIAGKPSYDYDGGVSYICATGHLNDYYQTLANKQSPYAQWVKAAEWKKFWQVEDRFCFSKIRTGLTKYDIHPPLYFWLLHVWVMIFGVSLWSGPVLNIMIDILAALVIYKIARQAFNNKLYALTACLFWAISPAVVETTSAARHYSLVALFGLLFVQQVLRVANGKLGWKQVLLTALIAAGGVLTYYHFVLLIAGSTVWLCFALRKNLKRFIGWLFSLGLGAVVFIALNPGFFKAFTRLGKRESIAGWDEYKNRLIRVACSMLPRWTTGLIFKLKLPGWVSAKLFAVIAVILFASAVIFLTAFMLRRFGKKKIRISSELFQSDYSYITLLFAWLWLVSVGLYLLLKSPDHAMGGRYLAMAWPFFAIAVVGMVKKFSIRDTKLIYVVWPLIIFASFVFASLEFANTRLCDLPQAKAMLPDTKQVLIDRLNSGFMTKTIAPLPEHIEIFAARQDDMLTNQDRWLEKLNDRALYMTGHSSNEGRKKRDKLLETFGQNFQVEHTAYGKWGTKSRLYGVADVYLLKTKTVDEPSQEK